MALDNNESAYLRKLAQTVEELQRQISTVRLQSDLPAALPGQYTGKPFPSTESCEITIPANVNSQTGTIQIAADGPFIAQRIEFAYRPTAGASTGFWRPLSHVESPEIAGALATDVIDFYWSYSVTGSHRNRQNNPVPSSLLTEMARGNGAWETFVHDSFIRAATIVVTITPTVAPAHAGVMWVGFHGCYVLGSKEES